MKFSSAAATTFGARGRVPIAVRIVTGRSLVREATVQRWSPGLSRFSAGLGSPRRLKAVLHQTRRQLFLERCLVAVKKQVRVGFLIVTPGLTIKDRLRVLLPNDPDSFPARRGDRPFIV